MKYLLIALLNCPTWVLGQSDLEKRSYLLIYSNDQKQIRGYGTVFFYKFKGKLLMITAAHNFTGYNYFSGVRDPEAADVTAFHLRVVDAAGRIKFIPLKLNAYNKVLSLREVKNKIDLEIIDVTKLKLPVHSIENLFATSAKLLREPVNVESVGAQTSQRVDTPYLHSIPIKSVTGHLKDYTDYSRKTHPLFFAAKPKLKVGYSGSPVFFRYPGNKRSALFAGMVVGGLEGPDETIILYSEIIEKRIKGEFSR